MIKHFEYICTVINENLWLNEDRPNDDMFKESRIEDYQHINNIFK